MKGEGRPRVILGPPDMAVESKAGNWRQYGKILIFSSVKMRDFC